MILNSCYIIACRYLSWKTVTTGQWTNYDTKQLCCIIACRYLSWKTVTTGQWTDYDTKQLCCIIACWYLNISLELCQFSCGLGLSKAVCLKPCPIVIAMTYMKLPSLNHVWFCLVRIKASRKRFF